MLLVGAILLAVFVLPEPWDYVAVIAGAVFECFETGLFIWYTRRRRPTVGAEAFVGRVAEVVEPLRPRGLSGSTASSGTRGARTARPRVGDSVRVRRVDGLTLVVEPG